MKQFLTFQTTTKILLILLVIFWASNWGYKYYEYLKIKKEIEHILNPNYRIKYGLPVLEIDNDKFFFKDRLYFETNLNKNPLVKFTYSDGIEANYYHFENGDNVKVFFNHNSKEYDIDNSTSEIDSVYFENINDDSSIPHIQTIYKKNDNLSILKNAIESIKKENKDLFPNDSIYYNTPIGNKKLDK